MCKMQTWIGTVSLHSPFTKSLKSSIIQDFLMSAMDFKAQEQILRGKKESITLSIALIL